MINIDYGQIINEIRIAKGLTQQQLADICGVSQTAIVSLEKGKIKRPGIDIIQALVIRLEVNPYKFIIPGEKTMFIERSGSEVNTLKKRLKNYEKHIKAMSDIMNGTKSDSFG